MRTLSHSARVCARLVAGVLFVLCALVVRSDRVSSQANLVAAWPFNEGTGSTSDDRSSNDHVATLDGATWATGKYGAGLVFDGVDDLVAVADAPTLDLTSALTIEAWIYPDVGTAARPIVHKAAASGDAYALSLTSQSKARVEVTIGGTIYGITGNTVLTDLAWTHVAATYNGAQLKVWVNGDLDGSATVSGSIAATTGSLSIGGDTVANTWFDGAIDEVRLYDVALTETQIESDLDTSIDDLTPPTITDAVPDSGTINVHPSTTIAITFGESLDPLTVTSSTIELRDAGNTLVFGTVGYDDLSHTATFTPSGALAQTAAYTVTVRGGGSGPVVKDVAGNALAATASWGFTTADIAPPTVTTVTPGSNARNVSLTGTIQATFSEAIDSATLTAATFVVQDTRNVEIAGAITYDSPTQTATFTPSAPLLPTRSYTVTLAGGVSGSRVEDLSGNALATTYSWSFLTTVEPSRIGAGLYHSVAVDDAGQVWTWGSDSQGQRGTDLEGKSPGAVAAANSATAVAAGENHTLALKTDGTLLAWGYNFEGQLGDNSQTNRTTPVAVSALTNVIAIAAGRVHSVALKSDGTVWTWGAAGLIGDGQSVRRLAPVQVTALSDVIAIAAGGDHTLALKGDGTVWSWGSNTYGQLGDGTTTARVSPVQVSSVGGVVGIAAGNRHSLAILADLTAKAWGANYSGQIGDGTTTSPRTSPTTVSGLTDVRSVDGGQDRSLASRLDGTTRIWGSTGTGTATTPTTVSGDPASWQIASGGYHTLLVTSDGTVSAVAHSAPGYGQLGDGTTVQPSSAIQISGTAYAWKVGTPEFNVASGTYNVVKVVTITVVTSGATIHYTLNGTEPTESDPTIASGNTVTIDESRVLKAKAWKSGSPASNVASATYTLQVATVLFSPFATTYTTAQNVTMSTSSPGATIRYTTDGSTPTEASAAYTAPIAIGTQTVLNAIGFRANWQPSTMRNGTYSFNFGTLAAPTLDPAGGTYTSQTVVTMSAAPGVTIRYTTDGGAPGTASPIYTGPVTVSTTQTLKARAFHVDWTASGTTTQAYSIVVATPTLSPTAGTYAAGQAITVSTATSGATLRYTLNGVEPTANDTIVPASGLVVGQYTLKVKAFKTGATSSATATATYAVTGEFTPPRVAGGERHSLAIRGDGTIFAWGNNVVGQLGSPSSTPRLLPTVMNGLTGASRISAGFDVSVAATAGQEAWGWGGNGYGYLGDGTTTARVPPVQPSGLSTVVDIVVGGYHALALKADGTVAGWGYNSSGQVGDGTTTQRLTPVAVSGLTGVTGIGAGQSFSLAVASDGTAWSWGTNGNGQLGTGNTTSRSSPGSISSLSGVTAVSAGFYHGLARLADGSVRAWGHNGAGQLGDGTTTQRLAPVSVSGLSGIVSVVAGATHSLAVDDTGVVWAWGANGAGQLGDGTTTQRTLPVVVSGLPVIATIAAGSYHSLAVGVDGSVWAWGKNDQGQLGDGTQINRLTPVPIADAGMSWKIAAPTFSVTPGLYSAAFNVIVTETDAEATMHYTTDGTTPTESDPVVASGGPVAVSETLTLKARAFKAGSVMSEVTSATYQLKVVTPTLTPTSGSYGSAQSVAMSTTTPGAFLTYTLDGTEPAESSTTYSSAIQVADTRTVKVRAFKTGWTSSDSGAASYWISAGTVATPTISPTAGNYSALTLVTMTSATAGATVRYTVDGTDPTSASPRYGLPIVLTGTMTVKAKAFLAGYAPSAVAATTFTVSASAGQSARPTITPQGGWFEARQDVAIAATAGATVRYTLNGVDPTASDPEVPAGGLTIDRSQLLKVRSWESALAPSAIARADFAISGAVAAGQNHSLALTTDGHLWAWGLNGFGQLGDGTGVNSTTPLHILADVTAIAAGYDFSMALKRDGTVWTWGYNVYGQLGHGNTFTRFVPTHVAALSNVVAIAAGANHALAMTSDGTVWAWGRNANGQLGDGTTTQRLSPVQVVGVKNAQSLTAGEDFSSVVTADGAEAGWVWMWGINDSGQLADGTTLSRTIPTRVPGLAGVVQVAAGRHFMLARMADGTVRAWGANDKGQLGIGTVDVAPSLQTVTTLAGIRTISAGWNHGLAVDRDGRLWGWGDDFGWQLGVRNHGYDAMPAPQLFVQVPGTIAVAGGMWHTLALQADGTVWGIGTGAATSASTSSTTGIAVSGFDAGDQSALTGDQDADGAPTWRELAYGTDPLNADSNANGLSDLVELDRPASGAHADEDGDGISSAAEAAAGTDPFLSDTDGDGVNDRLDAYPLDPTRHEPLMPTPGDITPPVITLTEPTNAIPLN